MQLESSAPLQMEKEPFGHGGNSGQQTNGRAEGRTDGLRELDIQKFSLGNMFVPMVILLDYFQLKMTYQIIQLLAPPFLSECLSAFCQPPPRPVSKN